jgi:hypothetical protein
MRAGPRDCRTGHQDRFGRAISKQVMGATFGAETPRAEQTSGQGLGEHPGLGYLIGSCQTVLELLSAGFQKPVNSGKGNP